MCRYCDEKALPCLMCGRACMEYQLDRTRCRGGATAHRPPEVWPVFRFCPYCGRDLSKQENQNENQYQGENEMARLIWTSEMDETVRRMDADGKSDAEICGVCESIDEVREMDPEEIPEDGELPRQWISEAGWAV